MREVVNSLMRRDVGLVPEQLVPHYQDVYDQVLRAAEWTEGLRDLVTTILETNLTIQGNRLKIITRRSPAGPQSSRCQPPSRVLRAGACPTLPLPTGPGSSPSGTLYSHSGSKIRL
jgi:hypothetical protein